MLRISEYVKASLEGRTIKPFDGVILIWNLTNRCNLLCKHCYSSAHVNSKEEFTKEEIIAQIPSLKKEGVKLVIFSGGEPLLREDIFEIALIFRKNGIRTYLSTNGTRIDRDTAKIIKSCFDYVGISIDGDPKTHEAFRGVEGSFTQAVKAIEFCLSEGIKTGVRFTLTQRTFENLPFIFKLVKLLDVPKLYISHLVWAGRGKRLGSLERRTYRAVVELIIRKAIEWVETGVNINVVTGNNDADGVLLYKIFGRLYPEKAEILYRNLRLWGGNQAGIRLVNIDHLGNVRPDPFFPIILGNIRDRKFEEIWENDKILLLLRERPRRIRGRCSVCSYMDICNGNSRARAYYATGDIFGEDPACYI